MDRHQDVVIIGGGVIGLSVAWRASEKGLRVLLLESEALPSRAAASWVAAGMLAPITEAAFGEEDLLRLNLESARRFPSFLRELSESSGREVGFSSEGTFYVALNRDQGEALHRLVEFQRSLGLELAELDAGEARLLEGSLHPSTRSAVHVPGDRAVDPRELTAALAEAARRAGARIVAGARVKALRISGSAVAGVVTDKGKVIPAGAVVLAAGCYSGLIEGLPDWLAGALRPVKGQILRLRPRLEGPPLITHNVRTEEVYLVPRKSGEVVVGTTVEEMGFDTSVTAGGVLELLRSADDTVPGIRELELAEASAGLRPATPDNRPIVGAAAPEGLIVATGHHRNGILLTPLTSEAVTRILVSGESPGELEPFSPERFRRRAA
jgi:glycine oxidase